jgi:hypothetical protein
MLVFACACFNTTQHNTIKWKNVGVSAGAASNSYMAYNNNDKVNYIVKIYFF